MSVVVDLLLGIVTSIGGFVEAGSISTAAQAGAQFGFQLLWAIAAATAMLAMLIEMSGRLAVVSRQSIAAAVRERFGVKFQSVPVAAELIIDVLLLAAEIGGAATALTLLTGYQWEWFVIPVGAAVWAVLWWCGFGVIEYGLGLLGLVTLSFVVSAWRLRPALGSLTASLIPTLPRHHHAQYAFFAVSILGATVSPYLLNFYASGTIEEKMREPELWVNRATSYLGMCFGGVVSMAVLVTSAMVLHPQRIFPDSYEQAALMGMPVFHRWAVPLFAASLGIGCFGAAVELSLNAGYLFAQVFGWSWGANRPRRDAVRFTAAFMTVLCVSVIVALIGFDPLRLTLLSVAFTVVIMPFVVLPFIALMNDPDYVKQHTSGPIGNGVLALLTILAGLLALVVIPLEIFGG
jgi:Mn2+/Fe2+ NRAMP family transporter